MKTLLVSKTDTGGGAAIAAFRLLDGLLAEGVDTQMWVDQKFSEHPKVEMLHGFANRIHRSISPKVERQAAKWLSQTAINPMFSAAILPDRLNAAIEKFQPNIINLHWTQRGQIQPESLKGLKIPIVITLHDMWYFTGGCHYTGDCRKFVSHCGSCEQLGSKQEKDYTYKLFERKLKAWKGLDFLVVSPSQWLAEEAKESKILGDKRQTVIPYGFPFEHFYPRKNREDLRKAEGISASEKVILFAAMGSVEDERKGFRFLKRAIIESTFFLDNHVLMVTGNPNPELEALPIRKIYLGKISNPNRMGEVYAMADVFVAPSVQDNLPNTVAESLACGTPVVAFDIGGMPDMIQHYKTGYLAQPFSVEDLVTGIQKFCAAASVNTLVEERESIASTIKALTFKRQAEAYKSIFQQEISRYGK